MSKLTIFIIVSVFSTLILAKTPPSCRCVNSLKRSPVCGSDKITYSNPQELECVRKCTGKKLKIIAKKPCDCICANTKEYMPVCANDGNTYVNRGAITCHNKCNHRQIKEISAKPCPGDENKGGLSN